MVQDDHLLIVGRQLGDRGGQEDGSLAAGGVFAGRGGWGDDGRAERLRGGVQPVLQLLFQPGTAATGRLIGIQGLS